MVKEIPLTQGKVALVDDDDFEHLNQFKWYALKDKNTYYARRNISNGDGTQTTISMHREILGTIPTGLQTDHIDGNGLNNQKSNLRVVTTRENSQNRHHSKTSRFPGVNFHKGKGHVKKPWQATIGINGKKAFLGYYSTEEQAFAAYKKAVNEVI